MIYKIQIAKESDYNYIRRFGRWPKKLSVYMEVSQLKYLHRENNLPAVENSCGAKYYFIKGERYYKGDDGKLKKVI